MSRVKIRELTEAENFDPDTDYVAIAQGNPVATRKLKVSEIAGSGAVGNSDLVVSPSRKSSTSLPITGQNNTSFAMNVTFQWVEASNRTINAEISADGTTWQRVLYFSKAGGAGYGRRHQGSFWVPVGWSYQIVGTGGTVDDLFENSVGIQTNNAPSGGVPISSPFYFCDRTRVSVGSAVNETKIVTINPALNDGVNKLLADAITAFGSHPSTIIVEMYIDVTSSPTGNRRTEMYVSGDPSFAKTTKALAKTIGGSRDDAAATGCANLQAFVPMDHDPGTGTYNLYWKWTGFTPSEYYIDVVGFGK